MAGLLVLDDDGKKKIVSGVGVTFDPTSQVSSLGILRTASSIPIFNRSERYDLEENFYFTSSTVSGATITHDTNKASRIMAVTSLAGSKAIRRTRIRFRYVKGGPNIILISANFKDKVTGIKKTIGQFSENNGWFIQLDGTTAKVGVRSSTSGSVVDTTIIQSLWDDPLDGTGPSGMIIDWNKQQLFEISYTWLGAAGVRFGVYHEGRVIYFHKFYFGNSISTAYSQTAVLPLRFEIENVSGTTSATMELTCYSVLREGEEVESGSIRSGSSGPSQITINTSEKIVFAIRINPSYKGNIKPINYQTFIPHGNSTVYFKVLYNPTVVGGVWANNANSISQSLTSYTSFSGGLILDEGYAQVKSDSGVRPLITDIQLGDAIDGTPDVLCLVARTVSSNSKLLFSGTWREDT